MKGIPHLHTLLYLIFVLSCLTVQGQFVQVQPLYPHVEDTITVIFNAKAGNTALAGYQGEVFMHSAISKQVGADDRSMWEHVQGNWGIPDAKVRMERIAPDLYRKRLHIQSFYGLDVHENFLQLSFVFRNADGSLVARPESSPEFYYPAHALFHKRDVRSLSGKEAINFGTVQHYEQKAQELLLYGEDYVLRLAVFSPNILRLTYQLTPQLVPIASEVIATDRLRPLDFSMVEKPDSLVLSWGNAYQVEIALAPLNLRLMLGDSIVAAEESGFFHLPNSPALGLRMHKDSGEALYGGGARAVGLDRSGLRLLHYHTHSYGYQWGETELSASIPFFLSPKGYGIYLDQHGKGWMDLGREEKEVMEFGFLHARQLSYYLIADTSPARIIEHFARLGGLQALPPRWALGHIHSLKTGESQSRVQALVQQYREFQLPLDAVVLNEYWQGGARSIGSWGWDNQRFPDAAELLQTLSATGIQTVLSISPYVSQAASTFQELNSKRLFASSYRGDSYRIHGLYPQASALLDIFQPSAKEWLAARYLPQLDLGVVGWNSLQSEPAQHPYNLIYKKGPADAVHNLYPLHWARTLKQGYQTHSPEQRPFHLSRAGFAGMQHYHNFPNTGDVARTWEGLAAQVPLMLGMGISGVAYAHSYLGGTALGNRDPELLTRWIQLGTFSPLMHSLGETDGQGLLTYDQATLARAKAAFSLRYQLLPYTYTLAWQNSQQGLPLARPLFYHSPQDPITWQVDDQYLWGQHLLLAPVLEAGLSKRQVYFPEGEWYDFYNDEKYTGNQWQEIPLHPDRIPVFVKAGAMIPMIPAIANAESYSTDTLILHVYPSADEASPSFQLYDDDGLSAKNWNSGNYRLMQVIRSNKGNKQLLNFEKQGQAPQQRHHIYAHFHDVAVPPKKMKWAKKKLKFADNVEPLQVPVNHFLWDQNQQRLVVHFQWDEKRNSLIWQ